MNPLILVQVVELLTKLLPLASSTMTAITQLHAAVKLNETLQAEGRDPTPEEMASLDAAFEKAHAELDAAIVQSTEG